MGIISLIVGFFSCSTDNESRLNRMENQEEKMNGQGIFKVLTESIIDSTEDDFLIELIYDNLATKQSKDYKKEFETVMSWNKSRQAIYIIWLFEGEVNNGGFNQFYSNPSGQFYQQLPQALELIKALKFYDLTLRANSVYVAENEVITKYQDGTIEGFSKSYDNNPLHKFDDELYKLYKNEDLQQLQINYIRLNKKDFVDN